MEAARLFGPPSVLYLSDAQALLVDVVLQAVRSHHVRERLRRIDPLVEKNRHQTQRRPTFQRHGQNGERRRRQSELNGWALDCADHGHDIVCID